MHTEEVVTRRGAMFYFSIVFAALFSGGMAAMLFAIGVDEKSWGLHLSGCLLLLVTWYLIRGYYRNAPRVRVTYIGIEWKGHMYSWDEVSSIALTGSQPMRMIGGKPMEGAAIVLNSGDKIILLDSMYSNLKAVRQMIVQEAPGKVETPYESEPQRRAQPAITRQEAIMSGTPVPVGNDGIQYVRGNSVFNMMAILAWMFIGLSVTGLIFIGNPGTRVFMIAFGLIIALVFTIFINYFGVSESFIVVRNVYRPWKKKMYALTDVREIILASIGRDYKTMRVILHDYSVKEFVGEGLSNRDWLALLNLLRSHGVHVKDENNFEFWVKPEIKRWQRNMAVAMVLWFVVLIISYMWITSLEVSANMLIVLKLGWLVFMVVSLIVTMRLLVRKGRKGRGD